MLSPRILNLTAKLNLILTSCNVTATMPLQEMRKPLLQTVHFVDIKDIKRNFVVVDPNMFLQFGKLLAMANCMCNRSGWVKAPSRCYFFLAK